MKLNNQIVFPLTDKIRFDGDNTTTGHAAFTVGKGEKIFVKPEPTKLRLAVQSEAERADESAGKPAKSTYAAEHTTFRLMQAAQNPANGQAASKLLKDFPITPESFPHSSPGPIKLGKINEGETPQSVWRPVLDESGVPVPRNHENELLSLQQATITTNQRGGPRSFSKGGPNDPAKLQKADA